MNKEQELKMFDPLEQRWSGLENDAMKLQGCSLLVPHDVYYEAGPVTLSPQRIHVGNFKFVDFPGGQAVRIVASSKKHNPPDENDKASVKTPSLGRIMPLYMAIAGKVHFTNDDMQLLTFTMMRKEDTRRFGSGVAMTKCDWPDVRALVLCPICAAEQQSDKDYWMILQHLQQIQMDPFMIATIQVPRLVCLDCFEQTWQNMVYGAGMRQEDALRLNPGFPVAAFPAPKGKCGSRVDCTRRLTFDIKMRTGTMGDLISLVEGIGSQGTNVFRLSEEQDTNTEEKEEGACLNCSSVRDGGNLSCSRSLDARAQSIARDFASA